jgi:CheY-like chemotaxis protein
MPAEKTSAKEGRVLVLEPDEQLASAILKALHEAAPAAQVDIAHSLQEAQDLVLGTKPELFVLDIDATYDLGQEFLYDLRTSHPNARAIILTAAHLPAQREQAAGLGAIHFLEKPFPHRDFVDLAEALLRGPDKTVADKFRGTLSDLHIADIVQLKCMSGATSALEFTGPRGGKARVFFEKGQVRHATAPGKEGIAAFNEIVSWKGGTISEVSGAEPAPRTIDQDWQFLLMEAVQKSDEQAAVTDSRPVRSKASAKRKVLVIDDSLMLLSFVEEVLRDANYEVRTVSTAQAGLDACKADQPDLILLDYILPDMKGDEVTRRLLQDPGTAEIPVVYMSGFGADLKREGAQTSNVIGFLNKPFTSDLLIETVEKHMPKTPGEAEPTKAGSEPETTAELEPAPSEPQKFAESEPALLFQEEVAPPEPAPAETASTEPAPAETTSPEPALAETASPEPAPAETTATGVTPLPSQDAWPDLTPPSWPEAAPVSSAPAVDFAVPDEAATGGPFFCGDTSFFSLNRALQAIAKQKLTGWLRSYWHNDAVELLARNGQIVLATTKDAQLYCPDAPITLATVDPERIAAARAEQATSGCPLFLTLAQEGLILREPAVQLVQHYGQKLFAQLWSAPRVRFLFERAADLPAYATDLPTEPDLDHWALASLRFIQFQDLGERGNFEAASIPAYTKDGFERAQNLKLTVAEAQFASQFNGARSIQQIAKNLRLDLKFARLTLFRFLALEIVECWPPSAAARPESKGILQRLTRSIGIGE